MIVCPTQSIRAGDLDDPHQPIAVMLARHGTAVRAPEQGTRPKLFYKGADEAALDPLRTAIAPDGMIWADTRPGHPTRPAAGRDDERDAGQVVARTAYTTAHPAPWKGEGLGLPRDEGRLGRQPCWSPRSSCSTATSRRRSFVGLAAPVLALAFAALTGVLLDRRPQAAATRSVHLPRPQWRSWLVRGAFDPRRPTARGGAVAARRTDRPGLGSSRWWRYRPRCWPSAPRATPRSCSASARVATSGRRRCCSRLLLAQAVAAGAASLLVVAPLFDWTRASVATLRWTLLGGVVAIAARGLRASCQSSGSAHVELAVAAMTRGRYWRRFWLLGVGVGLVVPMAGAAALLAAVDDPTARRRGGPGRHRRARHRHRLVRLRGCVRARPARRCRCRERRAAQLPAPGPLGRLGGVRRAGVGPRSRARAALPAHPHDVLQLRGVLRAGGLRRQGHRPDRPARGQPRPPRQPGPQLRQGPGDDQPGLRPRADPVPAEAGAARGARATGSGSRGTRRSPRSAAASARRSGRAATTR